MLKMGLVVLISVLSLAAAVAQTTPETSSPAKPDDEIVKLREEVERLHRTVEKLQGQSERQIEDLKRSMETRFSGVINGMDAARISIDAVRNAVNGIQLPKRPPITITADPAAPIVCGPLGCEATAADHCRKTGYDIAYVVHKLEKPTQWLFAFVCRDG
jgi:TolA-binding protein